MKQSKKLNKYYIHREYGFGMKTEDMEQEREKKTRAVEAYIYYSVVQHTGREKW